MRLHLVEHRIALLLTTTSLNLLRLIKSVVALPVSKLYTHQMNSLLTILLLNVLLPLCFYDLNPNQAIFKLLKRLRVYAARRIPPSANTSQR